MTQKQPKHTTAVILAGGIGSRIGLSIPKQLVKVAGKTILEHTITTFEQAEDVDDIVVLMTPDYVDEAKEIIAAAGLRKVKRVLPGGSTRNDTTRLALDAVSELCAPGEDRKLLMHDAVRPLVSHRIIADCVKALDSYAAVDVAIPSADTVVNTRKYPGGHEFITDVPERSRLRRGQTPQGFWLSVIREAYRKAENDSSFHATDDCSVVLKYLPNVPVNVVPGDESNIKITHPMDTYIADKLFQLTTHPAPQQSHKEIHRQLASKVVVIFGGSYGIGAEIAKAAEEYGAVVHSYSRSTTGTHVEVPEHIDMALAEAHAQSGRIDYVVNTAGLLKIGKLAELPGDAVEKVVTVNYMAPVNIARSAHGYLAASGGHLLFYTSSSYTRGRAGYSLYSSAKAALVNLTQALADEWVSDGVRVNCINPERTRTPMRVQAFGEEPAHSLLTSRSVADVSLDVLISGLTGQVIDIRQVDPLRTAHPQTATG